MKANAVKALATLALALILVGAVLSVEWPQGDLDDTSNEDVGRTMFGDTDSGGYGLVLLFIGVLLLVALLGGVFLAKEEVRE